MPYFSVIVPVYNRRGEVQELLQSLAQQSFTDFETIIVEDGSTEPCRDIVESFADRLTVQYHYKSNEGRSIARNHGIENARGDYFIFFDSDCVIPQDYFKVLKSELEQRFTPCFGGPDAASPDFNHLQKAISFAMTSFLTTGGIRGGKVQLEKFTPRSFNMGFSRQVWEKVGGFREMFSEDIDISTRIRQAGFEMRLIREAYVYHKRRNTLGSFARQTHVFGQSRITLKLLYPQSLKAVHCLPAVFTIGCAALVLLAIFWRWWAIVPIVLYALMLFVAALVSSRSLKVACLAVPASFIQLISYGSGFIRAYVWKILLRHGRDLEQEIAIRKGK